MTVRATSFFRAAILLWAVLAYPAVSVTTIADIAGDGAAHAVATTGTARWVQIQAPSTNSATNCSASVLTGCVRVGDSGISTSRGIALAPGASMFFPSQPVDARSAPVDRMYSLAAIYYLAQTGDKVSIAYAP